jgi:hypothetical protein
MAFGVLLSFPQNVLVMKLNALAYHFFNYAKAALLKLKWVFEKLSNESFSYLVKDIIRHSGG